MPTTEPQAPAADNSPIRTTKARIWLFRLALMTVVPAVLLLALELGLRLGGYGYATTFFVPNNFSGRAVYTDNPDFGLRFFPRALLRFAGPRVFDAKKAPGTYRIFVLGESAAEGVPASAYSFSRILEVMLQERYPGKRFEVINTGTTAINSHVILPIARECAGHEPDLFVVYMGNNEVIGPYGPATVLSTYSPNLRAIRGTVYLRSTKTGQMLNNLVTAFVPDEKAPAGWGGMAMFLKHRLSIDDPRLPVVYDHFQQNLNDICRAAIGANARVVLSTVGVNLKDSAPFASLHRKGLNAGDLARWDKLYNAGVAAETARNYPQAIATYNSAAKIDDQFADLRFRLARCYLATGEYAKAKLEYQQARDLDVVRFRTSSQLNNIIRTTAGSEEMKASKLLELADTERLFEAQSPYGIPGANLFYEHVHMNFHGNYLIARSVLEKTERYLNPPPAGTPGASPVLPEAECARRLALTPVDRYNILSTLIGGAQAPPFTNQLDHADQMARAEQEQASLRVAIDSGGYDNSVAQYRQALQRRPDDWMLHKGLADLLLPMGNVGEAVEHLEAMQRLLPHSPWAGRLLAEARARQFSRPPGGPAPR
jgi:tetratricopeptide (TPR) repeat protein